MFMATETVKVLRGTAVNALGDAEPTYAEVVGLTEVPFGITEKSRKVMDPQTGELRTARWATGRCNPTVDVRKGDQLLGNRSAKLYYVSEITSSGRGLAGLEDLVCDLRLV